MEENKILETFRMKHREHRLACQSYYDTCPVCQIIVEEQTDAFLTMLEETFKPIVVSHWKHWEQSGFAIANEIQPETLASLLAYNAFETWIQLKYYEIDITNEELYEHPYVRQKILDR